MLKSTENTQLFALWTIHRLESLASHSRPGANSSNSSSTTNGSSPNTTMRFTRQLPPVRTTLRVTLEVMLVVSRRFRTKAHLSHNQCIAFCQSFTSHAQTKLRTKRESGQKHCLSKAETWLCFGSPDPGC